MRTTAGSTPVGWGARRAGKPRPGGDLPSSARRGAGATSFTLPGWRFGVRSYGWAWIAAWQPILTCPPHTAMVKIQGEIASGGSRSQCRTHCFGGAWRRSKGQGRCRGCSAHQFARAAAQCRTSIVNDEFTSRRCTTKPLYAVVGRPARRPPTTCLGADQIYVDKASVVGSIGVLADGFGFTGPMDKLGVERRLMTAGENKGFMDPFSPSPTSSASMPRPCRPDSPAVY